MSTPKGYYRASDVLPEELARRAFLHLGAPGKVTFGPANRRLNGSEESLPSDLVYAIRAELDRRRIDTKRTLYFGPSNSRVEDARGAAEYLASKRMPLAAVADAIGVAYWTVRRWGIETEGRRRRVEKLSQTDYEAYYEAGKARCNQIRENEQRSVYGRHYVYVGWCLAFLKRRDEKKKSKGESGAKAQKVFWR